MDVLYTILTGLALTVLAGFAVKKWQRPKVVEGLKAMVLICSAIEYMTPDNVDEYVKSVAHWVEKWMTKDEREKFRSELRKLAARHTDGKG